VRFANIRVNTDKQLIEGVIETTYDVKEGQVADVDTLVDHISSMAGILSELVKINIDKDYRYFKELKEEVKALVEKELPAELQGQATASLHKLEQAKLAYDAAKEKYESLPDGPEKEEAKVEMQKAEQEFKAAQQELTAVIKEKERLVNDIANVIIKAIKELHGEYNNKKSDAKTALVSGKTEMETEVYVKQGLSLFSSSGADWLDKGGWEETMTESNLPASIKEFASKAKTFNERKTFFQLIRLIMAMESYYTTEDKVSKEMSNDNAIQGSLLIKQVIENKQAGQTEAEQIAFIKSYLLDKLKAL